MFKLNRETVELLHINVRTEIHGDIDVTAYDLKFGISLHNSKLEEFSPGLRASLYRHDENRDMIDPESMPHLIHTMLPEKLKLKNEIPSARLVVYEDGTNDEYIVLKGCKVSKFEICPKDGGSVGTTFTVSYPDEYQEYWDKIGSLLKQSMKVDLEMVTVQDEDLEMAQSENTQLELSQEERDQRDEDQLAQAAMAMQDNSNVIDVDFTEEEQAEMDAIDAEAAAIANAPEKKQSRKHSK